MRIAVLTLALLAADPAARAAGHALRLIDVPVPREGQWEKTSDEEGGVMHTYRLCEDGKRVAALHLGMECVGPNISHPAADLWVIETQCKAPGSSMHVRLTGEGDFDKAITSEITTVTITKGHPQQVSTIHVRFRYLGPCPPGEHAGE